jgi:hypothetical protein
MAYDEPGNSGIEVQLEATVDGGSLTGTWKSVDTGAKDGGRQRNLHGIEALKVEPPSAPA